MRRPPPRPRFGRPPVLYTNTGQQTKSWQTEQANLGTASAAAVTAGAGATREAREAAGAGLVGSTTISIFMGRSVGRRHRRAVGEYQRERKKQIVSSVGCSEQRTQEKHDGELTLHPHSPRRVASLTFISATRTRTRAQRRRDNDGLEHIRFELLND